jgi:ubiquinone/menaquinone biosynthesis C-methylase UbiE
MPMDDTRTRAARRHFDRWSATYEDDRTSRRLKEAQRAALSTLALGPRDDLLDVGCGSGAAVRDAARIARSAVGLDLSPGMIARARELAAGIENVEFREGSVEGPLPFEDGRFSALLCTTAFHHFTRPEQTLAEMTRVLAPGGRLVIADANGDQPAVRLLDALLRALQRSHVGFRRPSRLARELRELGLRDTVISTMWHGGYAILRADKPGSASRPTETNGPPG